MRGVVSEMSMDDWAEQIKISCSGKAVGTEYCVFLGNGIPIDGVVSVDHGGFQLH